jgi:hypothetical protein
MVVKSIKMSNEMRPLLGVCVCVCVSNYPIFPNFKAHLSYKMLRIYGVLQISTKF